MHPALALAPQPTRLESILTTRTTFPTLSQPGALICYICFSTVSPAQNPAVIGPTLKISGKKIYISKGRPVVTIAQLFKGAVRVSFCGGVRGPRGGETRRSARGDSGAAVREAGPH